jgi:hypothetical protein
MVRKTRVHKSRKEKGTSPAFRRPRERPAGQQPSWMSVEWLPPFFCSAVALSMCIYAAAFTLVIVWTGWSVRKHGWLRRSLRRFSYVLFLLLLAVRLAWCTTLLLRCRDNPQAPAEALRSTTAVALARAAFCLHFLAFSMLVCGWADSTYMMMSGRSLQVRHACPRIRVTPQVATSTRAWKMTDLANGACAAHGNAILESLLPHWPTLHRRECDERGGLLRCAFMSQRAILPRATSRWRVRYSQLSPLRSTPSPSALRRSSLSTLLVPADSLGVVL